MCCCYCLLAKWRRWRQHRRRNSSGRRRRRLKTHETHTSSTSSTLDRTSIADLAAISITDYERRLLPKVWRDVTQTNGHFCEYVVGRWLQRCPQLYALFVRSIGSTINHSNDTITDIDQHYAVVRIEALLLGAFIGQLLTTLNDANDDDAAANGSFEELCRSMARSYVIRSNNTAQWNNLNGSNSSTRWIPLGAKHPTIPIGCKEWSVLADSLIKEFAGARMTIDDVHEHELQLLIWKRFVHKLVAVMAAAMNKSTNTRLTIEN